MQYTNEKDATQLLGAILSEIRELHAALSKPMVLEEWIPRKQVMQYLSYGETQMTALERQENLMIARIGNRKFINRKSLQELIDRNIQG